MKQLTLVFVLFIACMLSHPQLSLLYAGKGLDLWFYKMIPTLLPFMILSGIMVRLQLTEKVALLVHPLLKILFRVQKNVSYGMLMGFLCGFPMGARVAADLYARKMVTKREAEYLLVFCNNIGPIYFCSFVLPLLGRKLVLPYLFGMYGIPFLYGLFLRYTKFQDIEPIPKTDFIKEYAHTPKTELLCCEEPGKSAMFPRFLKAMDESIKASMNNIFSLGGYMILFNLINLLPHVVLGKQSELLAPILEITGGLSVLGASLPLYSLLVLSFGGFSCLAQTYSCISETDLNFGSYIIHKIVLTLLNGSFYLLWFLLLPESFLL